MNWMNNYHFKLVNIYNGKDIQGYKVFDYMPYKVINGYKITRLQGLKEHLSETKSPGNVWKCYLLYILYYNTSIIIHNNIRNIMYSILFHR